MTRWNARREPVERPEYPKLVAIAGTAAEASALLPMLQEIDPQAEIVDGGGRGIYARVHNEAAAAKATLYGEGRSFPLADRPKRSPAYE